MALHFLHRNMGALHTLLRLRAAAICGWEGAPSRLSEYAGWYFQQGCIGRGAMYPPPLSRVPSLPPATATCNAKCQPQRHL